MVLPKIKVLAYDILHVNHTSDLQKSCLLREYLRKSLGAGKLKPLTAGVGKYKLNPQNRGCLGMRIV